MSGSFNAANNQITGPNGAPFQARGIGVIDSTINSNTASQVLSDFPGINMVRLAVENLQAPLSSTIQGFVTQLTNSGVVVEIEDHTPPSGGNNVPTGSALTNELNWYSSLAKQYAGNPYVWFGTMNEPSETSNESLVSSQEQQIYNAVRNAGNTNPLMLELIGGSYAPDSSTASDYANMTNVVWDAHNYGWLSNYSTDQTTVNNALSSMVSGAQAITSAEGKIPVIIGETGDATNAGSVDANWQQVMASDENSGLGVLFWGWGYGDATDDAMNTSNGTLNSYGQQVAPWIAGSGGTTPPPPTPTASPDNTVVVGTNGSIVDSSGNTWAINSSGVITKNGQPDTRTANVTELAYEKSVVWQENNQNLWWSYNASNNTWGPTNGTSVSPVPGTVSPDTLSIALSDASSRSAQFIAKLDGKQVGSGSLSPYHSTSNPQNFSFSGSWGAGTHTLEIDFKTLSGATNMSRQLYVDSASYDGTGAALSRPLENSTGAITLTVGHS